VAGLVRDARRLRQSGRDAAAILLIEKDLQHLVCRLLLEKKKVHHLFAWCASLWLAAALIAAVARAIAPFANGIWLVAYLFLVGFVAQVLLARGQATVLAAAPSDADAPPIGAQATLWNAGVVAVPLGVLVGARIFVVLGSVALLTALAALWQ